MLETVAAQLRHAASLLFGLPFSPRALDRLVDALLATYHEFGPIMPEGAELLVVPPLDEETRREIQLRRFRSQAVCAARETVYYERIFQELGLEPARLRHEDIPRLPPTPKQALRDAPDDFVCRSAKPCFRTTTTGTTGRPTNVSFSQRELHSYIALGAMHQVLHQQIVPEDIVLISTSARATLANTCFAGACARLGAQAALSGQIEPAHTLALLAEPRRLTGKKSRVSVLSCYPSYLGELVTAGLRLGYRPPDFGLARIFTGGEIVTAGLQARCQALFGPVQFVEGYGMTEPWPFGGTRCAEGHLHFEPVHGLLEVLDLANDLPAKTGAPGRIVATPFAPFRETTLLLRYDTEDIVRPIAGPLSCSLRHLPATSNLLGKLRLAVTHEDEWVFPRDVLEALEACEAVPLPARCGFWDLPQGVAVEVVVHETSPQVRRAIEQSLEAHGVPLRELHLIEHHHELRQPLPLRCDLREVAFGQPVKGWSARSNHELAMDMERGT